MRNTAPAQLIQSFSICVATQKSDFLPDCTSLESSCGFSCFCVFVVRRAVNLHSRRSPRRVLHICCAKTFRGRPMSRSIHNVHCLVLSRSVSRSVHDVHRPEGRTSQRLICPKTLFVSSVKVTPCPKIGISNVISNIAAHLVDQPCRPVHSLCGVMKQSFD